MKISKRIVAMLVIFTIIISNCFALLTNIVNATQTYNLTFTGAHFGNGESGYENNDVIYYYFTDTFINEHNEEEVHEQFIRVRIEENTPQGWIIANVFNDNTPNAPTATLSIDDEENVNTKYRINVEGDITQRYNVFINNQKVSTDQLQVVQPIPNDNYTITIINAPITDGMIFKLEKRIETNIEFFGNRTLENENTVSYVNNNKEVTVQLGKRTQVPNEEYEFTPIKIEEEVNQNDQNEEEHHILSKIEGSFEGYYLKINNPNEANVDVWIDGNNVSKNDMEVDGNTIWIHINGEPGRHIGVDINLEKQNMGPGEPQIDEKGMFLDFSFNGDNETQVKYLDKDNAEQTINSASEEKFIYLGNQTKIQLQVPKDKLDCIIVDVFDDELNFIDNRNGGDIHELTHYGDEDRNTFDDWLSNIFEGKKTTLDLSNLLEDHSFIFHIELRNPYEDIKPHTFSWRNDEELAEDEDILIAGGSARLVKAYNKEGDLIWDINEEYDESHYIKDARGQATNDFFYGEPLNIPGEEQVLYPLVISQREDGGDIDAMEGIQLIMEVTPDVGKQITYVDGGQSIEENNCYKVVMPARHVHFNAHAEEKENTLIVGEDTNISEISYRLDENAIDSGTTILTVEKADNLTDTQKAKFTSVAGSNYKVSTYLNVDLKQVWFKGTNVEFNPSNGYSDDAIWQRDIYDLGDKKTKITLTLEEEPLVDDIIILHELQDKEGKVIGYEKANITKKSKDDKGVWTVEFETSKFSNFAVATKIKKENVYNNEFKDVKETNWYYSAVKYVYENNIIKGLNSTTFGPNEKLTRGMLVTILNRMEGSPKAEGNSPFTDVKDSSKYYYNSVLWASENKIVSGYNDGRFGPSDNITRQQLAVILWKYAKYKGKDVSSSNDLKSFVDVDKISSNALTQMKWAVGVGIISGNKDKTLNPKGNATRAEVAAMITNYCKKVGI